MVALKHSSRVGTALDTDTEVLAIEFDLRHPRSRPVAIAGERRCETDSCPAADHFPGRPQWPAEWSSYNNQRSRGSAVDRARCPPASGIGRRFQSRHQRQNSRERMRKSPRSAWPESRPATGIPDCTGVLRVPEIQHSPVPRNQIDCLKLPQKSSMEQNVILEDQDRLEPPRLRICDHRTVAQAATNLGGTEWRLLQQRRLPRHRLNDLRPIDARKPLDCQAPVAKTLLDRDPSIPSPVKIDAINVVKNFIRVHHVDNAQTSIRLTSVTLPRPTKGRSRRSQPTRKQGCQAIGIRRRPSFEMR